LTTISGAASGVGFFVAKPNFLLLGR
jgi:hypothetical protein